MSMPLHSLAVHPDNHPRLACVLHGQRALLDEPGQWTRGALARNIFHEAVAPLSEDALRWSLTGSIAPVLLQLLGPRAAQLDWQRLYDCTLSALWTALPADHPRSPRKATDLDGFNDYPGTDHADVVDVIDRALDALSTPH
jgi:hypothetical protein